MRATPQVTVTLNQGDVRDALKRVKHAMSQEETLYYLCGVYMHSVADGLAFVACDGHRLAKLQIPCDVKDVPGVILPRAFVEMVLKVWKRGGDYRSVDVRVSRQKVSFGGIECEPIDGTFPDYTRVVPVGADKILQIRADQLTQASKAALGFCKAFDSTHAVRLSVGEKTLNVSADFFDLAGKFSLQCEFNRAGEPTKGEWAPVGFEIGVNCAYLHDWISRLEGWVELRFSDPGSPILLTEVGNSREVCVLMPMRI